MTSREAVQWNVAMKNSDLMSDLIYRTTMAELEGNMEKQFFCIRAMRNNVNYGLKKPEVDELDFLEKAFYKSKRIIHILSNTKDRTRDQTRKLNFVKDNQLKILRVYYRRVMSMLFYMGYFPRKENRENMGF